MNRPRRVHIDRLELDLRGISPATAEAAAHALGPALAQALAAHRAGIASAAHVDAGRLTCPASPSPHGLADGIAGRVARTLRGDTP